MALLACASALAACGSASQNQAAAGGVGPRLAADVRLADCTDWNQEPATDRLATIHTLRAFFGQNIGNGSSGSPQRAGAVLDDDQAYKVFENWCKQPAARGFKLYLLYGRAAGFAGKPGP